MGKYSFQILVFLVARLTTWIWKSSHPVPRIPPGHGVRPDWAIAVSVPAGDSASCPPPRIERWEYVAASWSAGRPSGESDRRYKRTLEPSAVSMTKWRPSPEPAREARPVGSCTAITPVTRPFTESCTTTWTGAEGAAWVATT